MLKFAACYGTARIRTRRLCRLGQNRVVDRTRCSWWRRDCEGVKRRKGVVSDIRFRPAQPIGRRVSRVEVASSYFAR